MPPSNVAIKADADKSLGGDGCLFTGPTSITLNSAGTMTVVSPYTKSGATTTNNCAGGTLAAPATQALPANGVIYVQNVPVELERPELPRELHSGVTQLKAAPASRPCSTPSGTRRS